MVDEIQTFLARRDYPKAIGALLAQSKAKPYNRRIRLRLCDVYLMAGRSQEAVPVFLALADSFAKDGFIAKAIAMLKRIEKIEPGRRDVESQLAKLIQDKSGRTAAVSPRLVRTTPPPGMAFGLEEIDSSVDIQLGSSAPAAPTPVPLTAPAAAEVPEFDESFAIESEEDGEEAPPKEDLSTPLFDGLDPDELVAVMRGLELVSFEAGDLIVVEGEVGDSMFILSSGRVKVYVRTPAGRSTKVDEFEEGDFFGEISVLTGKPRTATLTAAEECDCLVLNREALAKITALHPRVKDVLKKFQQERAMATVNTFTAHRG